MACFIVPLVQAVATTAYRKRMEKTQVEPAQSNYHALSKHLPALEKMLWGGSLMLIVDHILNGEVTWMYPFFTALETEGGGLVMLKEMLTVGVNHLILKITNLCFLKCMGQMPLLNGECC